MKKNLFSYWKKTSKSSNRTGWNGRRYQSWEACRNSCKRKAEPYISAAHIGSKEPDFYENPIEANKLCHS